MGTRIFSHFLQWIALLSVAFLLGSSFAYAQEEGLDAPDEFPDVEAALFEAAAEGEDIATTASETVELKDLSVHVATREIVETEYVKSGATDTVQNIKDISVQMGVFGYLLLLLLVFVAFLVREKGEYAKKVTFTLMVLVTVIPSLYFIFSTIYVNLISETRGPVHWHADFQIHACGVEYFPPEPEGRLENKTGTPVLHQHVDKRLHVEGVLVNKMDGSFRNFFRVQGGELNERFFTIPHRDGFTTFTNGDRCPDGSRGVWNVFLYKTDKEAETISVSKLEDYADYVPSPYIEVPPGDCLIFEFGPETETTDKICEFYLVDIQNNEYTPTWVQ